MSTELIISQVKSENHIIVVLKGEADISSSQTLKDTLYTIIEENNANIKLDCTDLVYIDSTGLGILVGALKKIKQHEHNIILFGLKDNIKKLFYITGLDKIFVIEQ